MDVKSNEKPHKKVKLRTIFIRYLSVFCAGTILLGLFLFFVFGLLIESGVIYPANYSEKELAAARKAISESESVTPDLIPDLCKYAVFSPDGQMVSGNLSKKDSNKAWNLANTSEGNTLYTMMYCYSKIVRKNDVCIVRYAVIAQYKSPVLRKYLPNPELFSFILFGLGLFLGIYLLATSFGKKLAQKMSGLQIATEKIQNQDLDFQVEDSGVLEIDNVLGSIDKMKEALKTSLEKQWGLEHLRREQISALAHDIKTPLTIVRGNTELLTETKLTEEQKEYIRYMTESTGQMEQYIKMLIEISKDEIGTSFHMQKIERNAYLEDLKSQINALLAVKKIKADFILQNLPPIFTIDPDLLSRAIMNVVTNAVDYSSEHGKVCFSAEMVNNHICFSITDSGKGFSPEALKQAAKQFYMEDTSRSAKSHYGMGLYIAKSITELHGGTFQVTNSPLTGGGQVIIEIPID